MTANQNLSEQARKLQMARRFSALAPAQREQFIQRLEQQGLDFTSLPIAPFPRQQTPEANTMPLAYAQRRLWFLWRMAPHSAAYNLGGALRLSGQLDIDAVQASLTTLVARHEVLRTTFQALDNGEAEQRIEDAYVPELLRQSADSVSALAIATTALQQPFDLEQGPLLRLGLISISPSEHLFWLATHHIVSDGWSMQHLLDELLISYAAHARGQVADLPPLSIQYADYASWQRHWLDAGELQRQLGFWQNALGSEYPVLTLNSDRPRPTQQSLHGARHLHRFDAELSAQLRQAASAQNVTVFMLLMAVFQVLLYRRSGQTDLRIGISASGRQRAETEHLQGFFVNTQVLPAKLDGSLRFEQVLAEVRRSTLAAQAHQDLPFEMLVDAVQPERSLSHNPLFQVKFTQQLELPDRIELPGLLIERLELQNQSTHFDIGLDITDSAEHIHALFTYATDLFEADTIAAYGVDLESIAATLALQPQRRVADWQAIAAISASCGEAHDYQHPTIVHAWAAAVAKAPGNPGLHYESGVSAESAVRLSLADMDSASNRLAHWLRAQGVGAESRVAICSERNPHLVIALLGVLKASAAYLPLDPKLPAERLAWLMRDAGVTLALCDDAGRQALSNNHVVPVYQMPGYPQPVDPESGTLPTGSCPWHAEPDTALSQRPHPEQAAYLIYTSGSTGTPKAVIVCHAALAAYSQGVLTRFVLAADASMAMTSSVSADLGNTVLFGALCEGRLLHLISADCAFDPDRFAAYMAAHQVGVLKIAPSHLQGLLQAANAADVLPAHALILGGESASAGLLTEIVRLKPTCRLLNHYGPTETTVGVLTHEAEINDISPDMAPLPIGRPLPNASAYLLDADLNPVPVGVAGELYLGGAGLARGYLGRAALTAEQFVPHPNGHGERLYRSGDQARWNRDGSLSFIGRNDDQVKIRGYRVELGEVTRVLHAVPGLRAAEALVGNTHDGRACLLAFVCLDANSEQTASGIKAVLAAQLPDYLQPSRITLLPQLPYTSNGKLDRKALLAIAADAEAAHNTVAVPGITPGANPATNETLTEYEQILSEVWADVLKRSDIGLHDNFFELGGDSILCLQIIARARKRGLRLTPKQLFEKQTIAELAQVAVPAAAVLAKTAAKTAVQSGATTLTLPLTKPALDRDIALTPIQAAFFEREIPQRQHWNQSVLLTLTEPLDANVLAQALSQLCLAHDALRLRYLKTATGWQQTLTATAVAADLPWIRPVADLAALAAIAGQAQTSLDLQQGRLLRAVLFTLPDGAQRLLLVIHHLVVDGVSWRILLEDLQLLCRDLQAGRQPAALAGSSSFADWAGHLHEQAADTALLAQADYWRALSNAEHLWPAIPAGHGRGYQAATLNWHLDQQRTSELLRQAPTAYRARSEDLLLAALAQTLAAEQGELLISLEGHGREDLFTDLDLSRSVGWFTSLYPVRLLAHDDCARQIMSVKETLRAIPERGTGFGRLRYLASPAMCQDMAALPIPRVCFNYLGQFDAGFEAGFEKAPLFQPDTEHTGNERDPQALLGCELTIFGKVLGGELSLSWVYDSTVLSEAQVAHWQARFEQALNRILRHCCGTEGSAGTATEGVAQTATHTATKAVGETGSLTPSDFPLAALTQAELDQLAVPAADVADIYPLAPLQQGLLFHAQYAPDDAAYMNQLAMTLDGLDLNRFRAAWDAVVQRHDILRTSFHWLGERCVQVVHRQIELPFTVLFARNDLGTEAEQLALTACEMKQKFDLACPPLLRLTVIKLAEQRYRVIWTRHHLLLDGWSTSAVLAEVLAHYHGTHLHGVNSYGTQAHQELLPVPRVHFRDYIAWLQTRQTSAWQAQEASFWQQRLARLENPTRLASCLTGPLDSTSPTALLTQGKSLQQWSVAETAAMTRFARQQRVTLNTLIQAASLLCLQRHSGQDSVALGVTVAGRPQQIDGIEDVPGLFINTLPLIQVIDPAQTVGHWLQSLQAENIALRDYEQTPLADIQRWGSQGGQALFDSILVFENYPSEVRINDGSALQVSAINVEESTHYALTLTATVGETLQLQFGYDRQRIGSQALTALQTRFVTLLSQLIVDPDQALGNLTLAGHEEQADLLQWNATATDYGSCRPLGAWIHEQVQRTPDAIALISGEEQLSYVELDQRARLWASALQQQGVGPDVLVAIAAERSTELMVGLLAILYAGGAYLPLDPDYPTERLSQMLADAEPVLLLTQSHLQARLPVPAGLPCLYLDQTAAITPALHAPALQELSAPVAVADDNLAYMIYTSGSTGVPKGAGNSHAALYNRLRWMQEAYTLTADDAVLQKTPVSFDVSVWELFWPLVTGARLVMAAPGAHRDPEALAATIRRHQISTVHFVPSMLQVFLGSDEAQQCRSLHRIVCSGEAVPVDLQNRTLQQLPWADLYNLYGPTEAAIDVTHWTCMPGELNSVPIGRPIANIQIHILDAGLNSLPAGIAGELYIGGIGLARGYHRRAGLSAERFVPDPFGQGSRLYRSGDLARWCEDGSIEYLGRIDHQIKIRGQRVELGEIEAGLLAHPAVRESVVVTRTVNNSTQLHAYVVLESGAQHADATPEALKAMLAKRLPEHMVPTHLQVLPDMPLSPNGKLDRKALPEPRQLERAYTAPESELEILLAGHWQAILAVEKVGRDDHFFAIGGHSLLAAQLVARLQSHGLGVALKAVFETPVLSQLAQRLESRPAASTAQLSELDAFLDEWVTP